MKKSLLELYALIVCFAAMMCLVIVLGLALWNIVTISFPAFTLNTSIYERHQTNEAFRSYLIGQHRYGPDKDTYRPLEGAALTGAREESYSQELRSARRNALQGAVQEGIILLIDFVLFATHWKIAKRARDSA